MEKEFDRWKDYFQLSKLIQAGGESANEPKTPTEKRRVVRQLKAMLLEAWCLTSHPHETTPPKLFISYALTNNNHWAHHSIKNTQNIPIYLSILSY